MEGRVLVTGFGAFGSHKSNVSEDIARLLDSEVVRNHRIESLILSVCLLYTSPSPRDGLLSRMPSSA